MHRRQAVVFQAQQRQAGEAAQRVHILHVVARQVQPPQAPAGSQRPWADAHVTVHGRGTLGFSICIIITYWTLDGNHHT